MQLVEWPKQDVLSEGLETAEEPGPPLEPEAVCVGVAAVSRPGFAHVTWLPGGDKGSSTAALPPLQTRHRPRRLEAPSQRRRAGVDQPLPNPPYNRATLGCTCKWKAHSGA